MKITKPTFRYIAIGATCCGNDLVQVGSSRYDLERLGCVPAETETAANLVIVYGTVNSKMMQELCRLSQVIESGSKWMAMGTCACGGGYFPIKDFEANQINIDVWVTGCPPRPEAIMNGVIKLQELPLQKAEQSHDA
jgi:NADH-quinone oxidoreductase subunit B